VKADGRDVIGLAGWSGAEGDSGCRANPDLILPMFRSMWFSGAMIVSHAFT
jgi:hypothetical protein